MGYHLNRLDETIFMAVSKPLLTEFDINHRLESCDGRNSLLQWWLIDLLPSVTKLNRKLVSSISSKQTCSSHSSVSRPGLWPLSVCVRAGLGRASCRGSRQPQPTSLWQDEYPQASFVRNKSTHCCMVFFTLEFLFSHFFASLTRNERMVKSKLHTED